MNFCYTWTLISLNSGVVWHFNNNYNLEDSSHLRKWNYHRSIYLYQNSIYVNYQHLKGMKGHVHAQAHATQVQWSHSFPKIFQQVNLKKYTVEQYRCQTFSHYKTKTSSSYWPQMLPSWNNRKLTSVFKVDRKCGVCMLPHTLEPSSPNCWMYNNPVIRQFVYISSPFIHLWPPGRSPIYYWTTVCNINANLFLHRPHFKFCLEMFITLTTTMRLCSNTSVPA